MDTHLYYIWADDVSLAIHKITIAQDTTQRQKTLWYSLDHIGSVVLTTDAAGVSEAMSYDTPRGFTGHEQLDAVGIIHMNGGIYDPELGVCSALIPICLIRL